MKPLALVRFLALALPAAVLAHFLARFPPGLFQAASTLRDDLVGPWRFPLHSAMGLLAVAAMAFAAIGLGAHVLARSRAVEGLPSFWQRLVFSSLIGWFALAHLTLLLGLIGLCNPLALGTGLTVTAALGLPGWAALWRGLGRRLEASLRFDGESGVQPAGGAEPEPPPSAHPNGATAEPSSRPTAAASPGRRPLSPRVPVEAPLAELELARPLLAMILLLYVLGVPYALTPAVESDELRYHLAAPEAYLEAGRVLYLPHQAMSNFPFLLEMLFTMGMALQGTEAARLLHLTFLESAATLIGLLAYFLTRATLARRPELPRRALRAVAAAAGVAFAAIPSVTVLGCWAFVDLGTAAYWLAVVYLGALALAGPRRPPAWLLGLMAAGAIGTKYSMIPLMAAVAGTLWLAARSRLRGREPARDLDRYLLRACAVAALGAAPWLLKNLAWTGNPVYPLAHGLFGGKDWSAADAAFYAAKAAEKGYRGWPIDRLPAPIDRAVELALTPLTTSLAGERFEGAFLGPLPLMAMAVASVGGAAAWINRRALKRRRSGAAALAWVAALIAVAWSFWFFSYQSYRLLLPPLALVFVLAAWGAAALLAAPGGTIARRLFGLSLRGIFALAALYSIGFTFALIAGWKRPGALPVALGFQPRERYLEQAVSYYPTARWLAARTGPDRKALLIGEHRTLYFPNAALASDWFDAPQPLPLLQASADNDEMFDRLRRGGVRYVYVNMHELRKYADQYFIPRFPVEAYRRFEAFMSDPRLIALHRDAELDIFIYEIADAPPAAPPAEGSGPAASAP